MNETLQSFGKGGQTPLDRRIDAMSPWFHNLHLPGGVQTAPNHPLGDFPNELWEQIYPHLPEDLAGWEVLDIGCNAGFFSFELAQLGARVTAVEPEQHYLDQARWAADLMGLSDSIQFRKTSLYELAHEQRRWDLVWFTGVLYHLRYPLLGLDIAACLTRRLLVLQGLIMPDETTAEKQPDLPLEEKDRLLENDWPKMAFIEGRMAGDPTNWWTPNHACMAAMTRSCGLRVLRSPKRGIYLCEPDPEAAEQRERAWSELAAAVGGIGPEPQGDRE